VVERVALWRPCGGAIAGAALDVLEKEPPDPDDPLLALPNFLGFPHIGTATTETRRAMAELCVSNLLAVLERKPPPACVNPEVLG
jgi:glyoxylate reductase